MKNLKLFILKMNKNTKFLQGVALGLFITSTISYAVVTFQTFTSGSVISSSAMNANFATIKNKLDELDIGFVGTISTDFLISTCNAGTSNPTYPTDYNIIDMNIDYNTDSGYNSATDVYTIPTTGVYRLFLSAETEDNMGYDAAIEISTDAGSTWTKEIGTMYSTQLIKKLSAGDQIRISAGCGNMASGGSSTVNSSKYIFAIKKF